MRNWPAASARKKIKKHLTVFKKYDIINTQDESQGSQTIGRVEFGFWIERR